MGLCHKVVFEIQLLGGLPQQRWAIRASGVTGVRVDGELSLRRRVTVIRRNTNAVQ